MKQPNAYTMPFAKHPDFNHLIGRAIPAWFLGIVLCVASSPGQANDTLEERCWSLTFEDHFDKLSLFDETTGEGRWRTRYIWPRNVIINAEEQFYIDPAEHGLNPFELDQGILSITASATPDARQRGLAGQPYMSGVLTSEKSFSQKHGRFEVRARVPAGRGLWSAFWLLPTYDQWPEGIDILHEIDVMEHIGHEPSVFHTTLHTNENGTLESYPADHTLDIDLTADFQLYTVVWDDNAVTWYLNGTRVFSRPTPRDYTQPMHLLLNLAVGGTWPGPPDNTTAFPASYSIDYVKVFKANDEC